MSFTGTPTECASLMMRNHADPGLIAAYLALELERDPALERLYDFLAIRRRDVHLRRLMTAVAEARRRWIEVRAAAVRAALAFAVIPAPPENLARLRPSDFT